MIFILFLSFTEKKLFGFKKMKMVTIDLIY
jgi:hypothetical protein